MKKKSFFLPDLSLFYPCFITYLIILAVISVFFLILEFDFFKNINYKIQNNFTFTECCKDNAKFPCAFNPGSSRGNILRNHGTFL